MIFAEKDAKNFRCIGPDGCGLPAVSEPPPGEPGHNLPPQVWQKLRWCIGAKCAGFAWRPKQTGNQSPDRKGFCGLAQTPGAEA